MGRLESSAASLQMSQRRIAFVCPAISGLLATHFDSALDRIPIGVAFLAA